MRFYAGFSVNAVLSNLARIAWHSNGGCTENWWVVMTYAFPSAGALDYATCVYDGSRLMYRGPKRDTNHAYIAMLGGSEAYGKFVRFPFPDLLEKALGLPVVNMGLQNAGPDVFLNDQASIEIAARAAVTVVQIFGAQNLSNRYYTVHPRRNDRFLAATPMLRALYPAVDFTEFHFTRHLLHALQHQSAQRFELLASELRHTWTRRMTAQLRQISGPTILLWVSDIAPPPMGTAAQDLFLNPMLIDSRMIAKIAPRAAVVINAVISAEARAMGLDGMVYAPTELPSAALLPSPYVHREICDALLPVIERLLCHKAS